MGRDNREQLLLIGDVMLDEYVWGEVNRISPEAPVPVVRVLRESAVLGGAANVACNLRALGAEVRMVGVVGEDSAGETLRGLLGEKGISSAGLQTVPHRPTTRKRRIVASQQQLVRVDYEVNQPLSSSIYEAMLAYVEETLPHCTSMVVSDYAKGVITSESLTGLADLAQQAGKWLVIGLKPPVLPTVRNAVVVLNRMEAEVGAGMEICTRADVNAVGQRLLEATGAQAVVITRGGEGLSVCCPKAAPVHVPAIECEVFDATGAGDTVLATLSLALARGADVVEGARLANVAGGCVVRHFGCAVPTVDEILSLVREQVAETGKLKSLAEMQQIVDRLRQAGRKIAFTCGCFDLIHVGHVKYLEAARRLGDCLIVGLNSDTSVRQLKGDKRPLLPEQERARLLAALECVDYVVIFPEMRPFHILDALRPDVHVKGGDYRLEDLPEVPLVQGYGGQVKILPSVAGKSSTNLMEEIVKRYAPGTP